MNDGFVKCWIYLLCHIDDDKLSIHIFSKIQQTCPVKFDVLIQALPVTPDIPLKINNI